MNFPVPLTPQLTRGERLDSAWGNAQPGLRWLVYAILLAVGVAILTLSAKTQIMLGAVPMTLQTLAVLMLAALYGPKLAMANIMVYMGLGAFGAPVFAGGGGLLYMMGPTGGYLLGFVLATFVVSYSARTMAYGLVPFLARMSVMAIGVLLIYTLGYMVLSFYIDADQAYAVGVAPFIVKDALSVGVAAMGVGVFLRIWAWLTTR